MYYRIIAILVTFDFWLIINDGEWNVIFKCFERFRKGLDTKAVTNCLQLEVVDL